MATILYGPRRIFEVYFVPEQHAGHMIFRPVLPHICNFKKNSFQLMGKPLPGNYFVYIELLSEKPTVK